MDTVYRQLKQRISQPEQVEASVVFLTEKISVFLKKRERVLICLPDTYGETGWLIARAVERCEGIPIFLGEDRRWMTLIRTAFSSRCSTIVAPPLILLGLSKLAKAMGVPLFIRNAILAGYPCKGWMREGMQSGLDCRTYGCFDPMGLIAGFINHGDRTLYLRKELFDGCTLDEAGNVLPDGSFGEIALSWAKEPDLRLPITYFGRVTHRRDAEGSDSIAVTEVTHGRQVEPDIAQLSGHLHRWTSILDCRVNRGDYGLELEIVTFPGEKLPKLPSCAKQVVRPWDPETEIPFSVLFEENPWENH